jgi:anti-anti-sigma factor
MHTLVLLGELDHASSHRLEAEIERVCETGVDGITLDLSGLTYIDATGVAVIVFRSRLCQRRGHAFALVPGGPFVQRAFETAGVSDCLRFVRGASPVGVLEPASARPVEPEPVASAIPIPPAARSPGDGDSRWPRLLGVSDSLNLRRWRHPDPC